MEGMMLQFMLVFGVVSLSLFVTMRFVTKRLWRPFEDTLRKTESFNVSDTRLLGFMPTDVLEFHRLNESLAEMMTRSRDAFRIQKEFTENASHELQTPLAVARGKLDLLMQENLTEAQLHIVSDLYRINARLEHLNRELLLLAKIDNAQYDKYDEIRMAGFVGGLLPSYNMLSVDRKVMMSALPEGMTWGVKANSALLESLLNNLVVNAIRHSTYGDVVIDVSSPGMIAVSNVSDDGPLDNRELFARFRSDSGKSGGNGLGLAIVKAICDFHGWSVEYSFSAGRHVFTVKTKNHRSPCYSAGEL